MGTALYLVAMVWTYAVLLIGAAIRERKGK